MKVEIKKRSKMRTLYNWMVGISFGITVLFVVYCLFVYIFPPNVVDIKNEVIAVLNDNKEVKKGGTVYLILDYCKFLPLEARIETKIEDGVVWELPERKSNFATGCSTFTNEIAIPKEIPVGEKVRIVRELYFKVSPFTEVKEIQRSEYFRIIE